jgi:hypothetical protein
LARQKVVHWAALKEHLKVVPKAELRVAWWVYSTAPATVAWWDAPKAVYWAEYSV